MHLINAEPPRPRIEAVRIVDMSASNSCAEFAALFRNTGSAFLDHERAKNELKALMPEDVSTVSVNAISHYGAHGAAWPSSAIGVWLLLDFSRQFNKSPDCFSTRWEVALAAAPVIYRSQKLLRYPHLEQAILRAFRWAATGPIAACHFYHLCIDKNASKAYAPCRSMASNELATTPNPSQWRVTHASG
jgi:hypothetical protein